MSLLDGIMGSQQSAAPDPKNPVQQINGVVIPNAAKMPEGFEYLANDQRQPDPYAKVRQVVEKLQVEPNEENIKNVVIGVAKGKPMDPKALLRDRRSTLEQELKDIVALASSDNELNQYWNNVKEGRDREARQVHYSPYGLKKYDDKAVENSIDPKMKAIADMKMSVLQKRYEGLQNQIVGLDEIENKLVLGGQLLSDADYQETIKALLTGAPVMSSKDREAAALARDQLALEQQKAGDAKEVNLFNAQKDMLKEQRELGKDQRSAEQDMFNREKDITDLQIKQQNADSQRISAEKDSARANKVAQSLKNKQVEAQSTLNMVKDISQSFQADLQSKPTKLLAGVASFLDSMGVDPGPDGKKLIGEMTQQEQGIGQLFNQYRKLITGAAAAMSELKYLEETFVNNKNSPEQAKVGLQRFLKMAIRDSKIFQEMADAGVNISDKNDLNGFYDTAKFRYNLNDPALVEEAERSAPSLFYDGPMGKTEQDLLKKGGQMLKVRGKWDVFSPSQIEMLREAGEIK